MRKPRMISMVKSSPKIRQKLIAEFKKRGLTNRDIVRDATSYGFIINEAQLSRYLTKMGSVKWSLTERAIIFLCMRYSIEIYVSARKGKYTDKEMLDTMKMVFPEIRKHFKQK